MSDAETTVSFSIRLTERQRDVLGEAARLRGWTMTSLLKNAAMEKSAHIINTTTTTTVNFKGDALEIARQLFEPRRYWGVDGGGDRFEFVPVRDIDRADEEGVENPVEPSHWPLPPTYVDELAQALRYGGAEFLALIVDAAREVTNRAQPTRLPQPIDPDQI